MLCDVVDGGVCVLYVIVVGGSCVLRVVVCSWVRISCVIDVSGGGGGGVWGGVEGGSCVCYVIVVVGGICGWCRCRWYVVGVIGVIGVVCWLIRNCFVCEGRVVKILVVLVDQRLW